MQKNYWFTPKEPMCEKMSTKLPVRSYYNINNLIVILIDEGSASASEILAGAVQDYDRGIILGRRSYGKGLVQEQYNLKDGAALRLNGGQILHAFRPFYPTSI